MGKLVDHLYCNQNQLKDVVIDNLATAPSSPINGQVYFDTSLNHYYGRVGTNWLILDNIYNTASDILANTGNGIFTSGAANTNGNFVQFAADGKLTSVAGSSLGSTHTHSLGGDLSGTTDNATVAKIRGANVSFTAPAANNILIYDGTNIINKTLTFQLTGGGDVSMASAATLNGTTTATATVTGIQGKGITLATGFLKYNGTAFAFDNSTYLTAAITTVNSMSGPGILINANAAGNITISNASNTVTLNTAQNITTTATPTFAGLTISGTGNLTLTGGGITFGSTTLTYSATPSTANDLITFGYIQNQSFGLRDFKESARVSTTANLAGVYANGTGGNSTITDSTTGTVLVIDGVTLALNERVLVKNQTNGFENGIYKVTTLGVAGATKWVLTRSSDFNSMGSSGNISSGAYVYVSEGTANQKTGWIVSNTDAALATLGTSVITFNQFIGAGVYAAGTGIRLNGSTFSVGNIAANTLLIGAGAGVDATVLAAGSQYQVLVAGASGVISWGQVNLASTVAVTGILDEANGGTGQSTYATGDILYATAANTLGKLAAATSGNVLISGTTPSWAKVGLSTHVSGILPIANGGTALSTTPTNGKLLIGNGTNYTLANLTAGNGISITNGAGSITIALDNTKVANAQYFDWNPSTQAATLITATNIHTGHYEYAITHTLAASHVRVRLIDLSTGEELIPNYFSATTLNVASPTYGSTTNLCVRFSDVGWTYLSTKTTIKIILEA